MSDPLECLRETCVDLGHSSTEGEHAAVVNGLLVEAAFPSYCVFWCVICADAIYGSVEGSGHILVPCVCRSSRSSPRLFRGGRLLRFRKAVAK